MVTSIIAHNGLAHNPNAVEHILWGPNRAGKQPRTRRERPVPAGPERGENGRCPQAQNAA